MIVALSPCLAYHLLERSVQNVQGEIPRCLLGPMRQPVWPWAGVMKELEVPTDMPATELKLLDGGAKVALELSVGRFICKPLLQAVLLVSHAP